MFGVLSLPGKQGRWDEDEFYQYGRAEVDTLFSQLAQAGVKPESQRALDFGCGVGRLTFPLAERFAEVDGVDISPSMVEFARSHNQLGDRCRFHLYDGESLEGFDTDTFDLVVCLMTLQHVPPFTTERYLAEMVRITRPNGIIAVQIPDSRSPQSAKRQFKERTVKAFHQLKGNPQMEMHARRVAEVAEIFQKAGAAVVAAISDARCGNWGPSFLHVALKAGPERQGS